MSGSIQLLERDGERGIVEHGLDARKTLGVAPDSLLGLGERLGVVVGTGCIDGGGTLDRLLQVCR